MRRVLFPFALVLTSATLAGCPPAFVDQPTKVPFAPDGEDFWSAPFPSDLRIEDDGTTDIERWPGDWDNDLLTLWLRAADRRLTDGWGLQSGVFFRLPAGVDAGSLPDSPEASTAATSTVFLVDIDKDSPEYGRRFPLKVRELEEVDLYTPEHLLAVLPVFGFVRRPHTTYAAVITDGVLDEDGAALGRSRVFHDALTQAEGPDTPYAGHLQPLVDYCNDKGVDLNTIVGASVFTTYDPNRDLRTLVDYYESLDDPMLVEPWTVQEEYDAYQVLTARYEVPLYQTGNRPYAQPGQGLIVWGDDGFPVEQERQGVRLALTIPKQPQPEGGFPLTIYMHGSGGEYYQAINRGPREEIPEAPPAVAGEGPAEWLARRGIATVAFDYPLHGDRATPPDESGLKLYNILGNPDATVDNFNVAAAETTYLSRLMLDTRVDAALADTLDAGGASDGLIKFDPERLTAMGQSMGTTLGVATATVDPRIKGFLFSGAGGVLVEIAVTAVEPFPFRGTVEVLIELDDEDNLHVDHPLLHALQQLWDYVDPVVKARHISAEPFAGYAPRQVMMTAGVFDGYFFPRSQAALATNLGADLVGTEVEPILPDTLRLNGHRTADFPLRNNVNGATVGVVQFEAPHTLGHYVVFNQDGARFQYTCFLKSVGDEATIPGPAGLTDECP